MCTRLSILYCSICFLSESRAQRAKIIGELKRQKILTGHCDTPDLLVLMSMFLSFPADLLRLILIRPENIEHHRLTLLWFEYQTASLVLKRTTTGPKTASVVLYFS